MSNQKALQLMQLGLQPVLLGKQGDALKRPLLKHWQTAVYTPAEIATWPERHNIGIRCGLQRNSLPRANRGGRFLLVFDFDEEADRIFPVWLSGARTVVVQDFVIVTSGRGYHVYFYVPDEMGSRTLAGRRVVKNGRSRLQKFIETIGRHKQVVSAGSLHPSGSWYQFYGEPTYKDIPALTMKQLSDLTLLARRFDERPIQVRRQAQPDPQRKRPRRIQNCLDYARRYIGTEEQVEPNGDIRFLGQGGLIITADGRGWYAFSDETGGGLTELITWYRQQMPVGEAA